MSYGPIIISIEGYHIQQNSDEAKLIQHPLVGGVILFTDNHQNKTQLTELTSEIKHLAHDANKDIIIMVDHEGGSIQRFIQDFSPVPSAKSLGEIYDINPETSVKYAYQLGTQVGYELKACNIDVVLGPVVDLDNGNAVISGKARSYHQDPATVTAIAGAYIDGLKESGMSATLKHFPGHGADIGDSHITKPVDNRTMHELTPDLLPFKNLIETDTIGAVMPAHVTYPKIDPENTAGTSKIWLKDILRTELSFDGVIISDCLSMKGSGSEDGADRILKTLQYCDLVIFGNQTPQEYLEIFEKMKNHDIPISHESQHRIEHWLTPAPSLPSQILEDSSMVTFFEG